MYTAVNVIMAVLIEGVEKSNKPLAVNILHTYNASFGIGSLIILDIPTQMTDSIITPAK